MDKSFFFFTHTHARCGGWYFFFIYYTMVIFQKLLRSFAICIYFFKICTCELIKKKGAAMFLRNPFTSSSRWGDEVRKKEETRWWWGKKKRKRNKVSVCGRVCNMMSHRKRESLPLRNAADRRRIHARVFAPARLSLYYVRAHGGAAAAEKVATGSRNVTSSPRI